MASGDEYERLFKLWAIVAKLVVDGRRSAPRLIDLLQSVVDDTGSVDVAKLELYIHPGQLNGGKVRGYDIEKYLRDTGLIDRCLSVQDDVVKGWMDNPLSYPWEFRDKMIFLWKSTNYPDMRRGVAYLSWSGGVTVRWGWCENELGKHDHVLLKGLSL